MLLIKPLSVKVLMFRMRSIIVTIQPDHLWYSLRCS